jgi:methylmalonyl-CoA mutase N-terminal domain/subunit
VAFDLPTQIGYDSDHPLSRGEVGKAGVPVDSLEDMEIIFQGLPLDKLSTSMTINAPAAILLAMYLVLAEKQGVPFAKLRGTIQNDILKEYTVRGLIFSSPAFHASDYGHPRLLQQMSPSGIRLMCPAIICAKPAVRLFRNRLQFFNAIAYLEAGLKAGLDDDSSSPDQVDL